MNAISKQFDDLRLAVNQVEIERNQLRDRVKRLTAPKATDSDLSMALRKALANESGWRENARQVLGDYSMIECEICGVLFPSGGMRKKTCGKHPKGSK